jgi:6-phosphogluconolactonase
VSIQVFRDAQELAHGAAEHFYTCATSAIAKTGRFTVALTGGSTPREIYQLMARPEYASRIDWSGVHVFWGDERCVGPDDPESNYGMARDALLAHVPIPDANVHRMRGEEEPPQAAAEYEQILRNEVGERFDLVLLGMGSNTHIASLFPHSAGLHEQKRWVIAPYVEEVSMWRITVTPPVINRAARVTFLVAGSEKAEAVKRVLEGSHDPDAVPAQIVAPQNGELLWLLDQAAASRLSAATLK